MSVPSKVQRAEAVIRELIIAGAPGDRLPSEAELAVRCGVSRVTVREALDRLWNEGEVVRRWGAGTYIAERAGGRDGAGAFRSIYVGVNGVTSLPAEIAATGHQVSLTSFAVTQAQAPDWVGTELGSTEQLWLVTRCLGIDETPAILMRDYLPRSIEGNTVNPTELSDVAMDLPQFLRRNGARIVKHESTLDAATCDADSADLLGMTEAAPVLRAMQRAVSDKGEVATCAEILYRSDVFNTVIVRTITD